MPVFIYKAVDPATMKSVEGKIEAGTVRQAKEAIRETGLMPQSLQEQAESSMNALHAIPFVGQFLVGQVTLKALYFFTVQLATLLDAGIPLIEALFLLEQQSSNNRLKEILHTVRAQIIAGDSFSDTLRRYPSVFNVLYVSMIQAGEVSGDLDNISRHLSELMEKLMKLRQKIAVASIYPVVSLVLILVIVEGLLLFVVPQFASLYASKGAKLPEITQFLLAASDFSIHFWWAALIGFGILVGWFQLYRSTFGKTTCDTLWIKIPVVGTISRKVYTSQFIRTMATLLSAGVPITEAILTAGNTVDNDAIRVAFRQAREHLLMGATLSRPLEETKLFPMMVTRMIGIGEETGSMEKMLNKAADFLDIEVDMAIETFTKLIEPVMIVIVGTLLLGMLLGLYIPLFDLSSVIAGSK
jgi:type IV pilus assembly protein PilC